MLPCRAGLGCSFSDGERCFVISSTIALFTTCHDVLTPPPLFDRCILSFKPSLLLSCYEGERHVVPGQARGEPAGLPDCQRDGRRPAHPRRRTFHQHQRAQPPQPRGHHDQPELLPADPQARQPQGAKKGREEQTGWLGGRRDVPVFCVLLVS